MRKICVKIFTVNLQCLKNTFFVKGEYMFETMAPNIESFKAVCSINWFQKCYSCPWKSSMYYTQVPILTHIISVLSRSLFPYPFLFFTINNPLIIFTHFISPQSSSFSIPLFIPHRQYNTHHFHSLSQSQVISISIPLYSLSISHTQYSTHHFHHQLNPKLPSFFISLYPFLFLTIKFPLHAVFPLISSILSCVHFQTPFYSLQPKIHSVINTFHTSLFLQFMILPKMFTPSHFPIFFSFISN